MVVTWPVFPAVWLGRLKASLGFAPASDGDDPPHGRGRGPEALTAAKRTRMLADVRDGLTAAPGLVLWVVVVAILVSTAVSLQFPPRSAASVPASPSDRHVGASLDWLKPFAVLTYVPCAASLLLGADLSTALWWLTWGVAAMCAFVPPAAMAVAYRRLRSDGLPVHPDDRRIVMTVAALTGTSVLTLLGLPIALVSAGVALAAACTLGVGVTYALGGAAYAAVRLAARKEYARAVGDPTSVGP